MGLSVFSGPNKLISKTLKSLVSLYSTSSSEIVSVLLELLLKALDSSSSMGISEDSESGPDRHTALDDWQLVIRKFSNKEPELLLALLQRILDMIGTNEASKYETGKHAFILTWFYVPFECLTFYVIRFTFRFLFRRPSDSFRG